MTRGYFLVLDKCNTGRASVIFLQAQCRLRYITVTLSAKGSIFKVGHDYEIIPIILRISSTLSINCDLAIDSQAATFSSIASAVNSSKNCFMLFSE